MLFNFLKFKDTLFIPCVAACYVETEVKKLSKNQFLPQRTFLIKTIEKSVCIYFGKQRIYDNFKF